MTKTDEKILAHLEPISDRCDTYFCFISKYKADEFMHSTFNKTKAWVEKNGGTIRKLDGGKLIVDNKKGFEIQIRFPTYTKRDMKSMMATLYRAKIEEDNDHGK